MSLATWKELYYPVHASEAVGSELEAARHSLRKWEGLRDLKTHGVLVGAWGDLLGESLEMFGFDGSSCALCRRHGFSSVGQTDCGSCVLTSIRGVDCNSSDDLGIRDPYRRWVIDKNPEPMIALLQQAVERLEVQEKTNNTLGEVIEAVASLEAPDAV